MITSDFSTNGIEPEDSLQVERLFFNQSLSAVNEAMKILKNEGTYCFSCKIII